MAQRWPRWTRRRCAGWAALPVPLFCLGVAIWRLRPFDPAKFALVVGGGLMGVWLLGVLVGLGLLRWRGLPRRDVTDVFD